MTGIQITESSGRHPNYQGDQIIFLISLRENFREFLRYFRENFQVFASFLKFLDLLGPVRMCSYAFGCIRMPSDAFGFIRTLLENVQCVDPYPASASPTTVSGAWFGPGPSVLLGGGGDAHLLIRIKWFTKIIQPLRYPNGCNFCSRSGLQLGLRAPVAAAAKIEKRGG